MLKLFDMVRVLIDIPAQGVQAGWLGSVVQIHQQPNLAYEIEFAEEGGRTVAVTALKPEQLEFG
jgi:hypothetical protein